MDGWRGGEAGGVGGERAPSSDALQFAKSTSFHPDMESKFRGIGGGKSSAPEYPPTPRSSNATLAEDGKVTRSSRVPPDPAATPQLLVGSPRQTKRKIRTQAAPLSLRTRA